MASANKTANTHNLDKLMRPPFLFRQNVRNELFWTFLVKQEPGPTDRGDEISRILLYVNYLTDCYKK